MKRIRVILKITSDDAFELKAQALNNDPRLKAAGIAALKFVGDKNYIADGNFSQELPPQQSVEPSASGTDSSRKLRVVVRIPNEDSYELKAQALNKDPHLKDAGIAALRFVGDKQYIVDGEFNTTTTALEESDVETPKQPVKKLRVTIRMEPDKAYQLVADHLNSDPRLQEAGISDVKLIRKQSEAVAPVPIKRKPLGCLKWGLALGVIGALIIAGGAFAAGLFSPVPATPAKPAQKPPTKIIALPNTKTPFVAPLITFTSAPKQIPPTDTPIPVAAQPDCSNDFSSDINHWPHFIVDGGPYAITDKTFANDFYGIDQDGWFLFDVGRGNTWVYSICDQAEYANVRIDTSVENLGTRESATVLICRYTEGVGWYEFNIRNNGEYDIMFTYPTGNFLTDYVSLDDGASNFINTSDHAINNYTAICQGNTLTLIVNDHVVKNSNDASILTTGRIGIGLAWSDTAAKIRFDYVTVTPQ